MTTSEGTVKVEISGPNVYVTFDDVADLPDDTIERILDDVRERLTSEAEHLAKMNAERVLVRILARRARLTRHNPSTCVREARWVDVHQSGEAQEGHCITHYGATVTKLADDGTTALVRYNVKGRTAGTACQDGWRFLLPLATFNAWLEEHSGHSSSQDCLRHVTYSDS